MLREKVEGFSIERLIRLLAVLGGDLVAQVRPS
jgi:hypothetical protein